MATARPELQIPLTNSDKIVEVLCWSGLIFLWLVTFYVCQTLPETIPVHYNALGKTDRLGDKSSIWFLPAITTVLVLGLSWLNRYPHTFNFPVEITPANAEQNYKMATRLMRYIKLFVVALFGAILITDVQASGQDLSSPGSNPVVITILILTMLSPVAVLLYISRRSAS